MTSSKFTLCKIKTRTDLFLSLITVFLWPAPVLLVWAQVIIRWVHQVVRVGLLLLLETAILSLLLLLLGGCCCLLLCQGILLQPLDGRWPILLVLLTTFQDALRVGSIVVGLSRGRKGEEEWVLYLLVFLERKGEKMPSFFCSNCPKLHIKSDTLLGMCQYRPISPHVKHALSTSWAN